MEKNNIKRFQNIKRNCEFEKGYCKFIEGEGKWCIPKNLKCSLNTCFLLHPPSFPMENSKKQKSNLIKKSGERCTPLSKQEIKAYKLYLKGWSFMRISKSLNCSKSMAYKRVKKVKGVYKMNKGVGMVNDKGVHRKVKGVRLHRDSFSFLIEPISFWGEKNIVKLKYCKYLLVKEKGLHIQIFENKLVVLFLDDIVCDTVEECLIKGNVRVNDFLRGFKYKGVRFLGERFEQVSRHYALLENGLAKKYVKEKRKFYVKDKVDGKVRLSIDYSHGNAEFEAEHPKKSFGDASKCESYFDDIINKDHYKPSELKGMFDIVMKVQVDYARNIEEHLKVMREIKEGIKRLGK